MEVREARSADLPRAAEVLAQAFCTDPPLAFLVASARGRLGLLRRYFGALLPLYLPRGVVQVTDDGSGAAAWVEPGRWPFTFREQLPAMPTLLRVFGAHPVRAVRGVAAIERGHPHEPHWYLDYTGVRPGSQRRGTGSALLASFLERVDREGAPAYLNAGSSRSRDLYARHGFESTERFELPGGGPPLWRMWRTAV
jgi:GNAT superfamily N-acetyltransferase